jgi:predicted GNAT family acetyltransferase
VASETDEATQNLAADISKREASAHVPLRSVMLPQERASTFAQDFRTPVALNPRVTQNLMSVTKLNAVDPSEGLLRFALAKDLKLLTTWSQRFAEEAGLDESPHEAKDIIQKYFDAKQLFVWDDKGRATAMAAIGGFTPHAARISMVYTDPTLRGKGYASTLVHRVSHKIIQDGKTSVLFADAANVQTNHIYGKLGYRTISQFTELKAQS